jgi:hypothetical protein
MNAPPSPVRARSEFSRTMSGKATCLRRYAHHQNVTCASLEQVEAASAQTLYV